jgi:hypothetical protein
MTGPSTEIFGPKFMAAPFKGSTPGARRQKKLSWKQRCKASTPLKRKMKAFMKLHQSPSEAPIQQITDTRSSVHEAAGTGEKGDAIISVDSRTGKPIAPPAEYPIRRATNNGSMPGNV